MAPVASRLLLFTTSTFNGSEAASTKAITRRKVSGNRCASL